MHKPASSWSFLAVLTIAVIALASQSQQQQQTTIPLSASEWDIVFNGNNSIDGVQFTSDNRIILKPMAHNAPWDLKDSKGNLLGTSSCLLAAKNHKARKFELQITAKVLSQTRVGYPPRAWESFWSVFNYRRIQTVQPEHHEFNYFIHKPSTSFAGDTGGVEIGTATELVAQTFIGTHSSPVLTLNKSYTYTIRKQSANNVSVTIDGQLVDVYKTINSVYTRVGFPYVSTVSNELFDSDLHTNFGLYTEDAIVEISSVKYINLDAVTPTPVTSTNTTKPNSAFASKSASVVSLFLAIFSVVSLMIVML